MLNSFFFCVVPGAGVFILRLLHICAAVYPSVSQYQYAALWPEGHGVVCLQLYTARYHVSRTTIFKCSSSSHSFILIRIFLRVHTEKGHKCSKNMHKWMQLQCVMMILSVGVLVLFLAFFAFLHCWLNAFAEMLRFGDRMFYKVTDSTNRLKKGSHVHYI